ncbi:MAG TPA: 4-hydroxythreonine-4-phosphate dehydrogenase PdxA [Caulobacteraceae bacterium]|nr:4-hydroxythreonine-4-phosphate dehydrogenase PdxA [Caulobacteraceae bacterium]
MTGASAPIAVSLGDPAGIGPEIVVKAWQALRHDGPPFLVIGDHEALAAASARGSSILARVGSPAEARRVFPDALPVFDMPLGVHVVAGQPSSAYAARVVAWIETAVGLALSGAAQAVVTAPIAKAPLYEAGFGFPGHTEFLGELTAEAPMPGPRGPVMMLAAGGLRAVPVTIHEPYIKAPGLLTTDMIVHAGEVVAYALKQDFGVAHPRLALAGLNPHAGESGALGREEIDVIAPAAARLRARGIDCTDPRPADTLFHPEARAGYDAVLCMYHDQALIPVKMLDFWGGVNLTLGLPIVRTSPDHGVGYDIAGRGLARADSLIAALRLAADIAERRQAARP